MNGFPNFVLPNSMVSKKLENVKIKSSHQETKKSNIYSQKGNNAWIFQGLEFSPKSNEFLPKSIQFVKLLECQNQIT